ncbi:hypothetical protein [Streptomyces variegatus]|uniref:hypothetical protein n=1 Tax=Streptomyces variegatus TaxID=284040 RepID=UPI003C2C8FAF
MLTERLHVKDDGGIPKGADQRTQCDVEVSGLGGQAGLAQFVFCLGQFRGHLLPIHTVTEDGQVVLDKPEPTSCAVIRGHWVSL